MVKRIASFLRTNLIALAALFVALGGTAWAASKVGAGEIKNDAVKSRHIDSAQVGTPELEGGAVTASKLKPAPRSLSFTEDSQSIGSSFTDLTFDEFRVGADDALQPAENLVVVNKPGVYSLSGEVHWSIDGTGDRRLRLLVTDPDGDASIVAADYRRAANSFTTGNVATTELIERGSAVSLQASQTSAAPLATEGFDDFAARLAVHHLGPPSEIVP